MLGLGLGDPPGSRAAVSKKAGKVQIPWVWVFFLPPLLRRSFVRDEWLVLS